MPATPKAVPVNFGSKQNNPGVPWWVLANHSTAAPPAPSFSPLDITTSLFPADAQIYNGSNLIDTWTDAKGVANATQSTGAMKPTYVASAVNGYGVLRNTTSTFMDFGSASNVTIGTPASFFIVAKVNTQGGTWYSTLLTLKGGDAGRVLSLVASNDASYGNLWLSYIGSASPEAVISAASATATGSYLLFIVTYNGGSVSSTASFTITINSTGQTLSVPAGTAIGPASKNYLCSWSTGTPAFALPGDVAEWGFSNTTAWSAQNKADLWTYYQSKFAL